MGRSKRPGSNVRAAGSRSTRHYYSGRHSRARRLPLVLIALLFLFAGTAAVLNAMRPHAAAGAGYWHTSGTEILDENNAHVRIAGVTWYGMESSYWVPAGLDYQPYTKIMDLVKSLGYNAIRLPFSNELVETNPIVTDKVAANPQFKGMHALTVMDAIVRYAHKISLKIILDDHRCHAS